MSFFFASFAPLRFHGSVFLCASIVRWLCSGFGRTAMRPYKKNEKNVSLQDVGNLRESV